MKIDLNGCGNRTCLGPFILSIAFVFLLLGCEKGNIFEASRRGEVRAIEDLSNKDTGLLYSRDSVGRTPLHLAAVEGHEATIRLLLDKGLDPGTLDRVGFSSIDYAKLSGSQGSVDLLEAEVSLHDAARRGDLELMRKIIVDDPESVNRIGPDGGVPLQMALDNSDTDAVELLLREGASPNHILPNGESLVQVAVGANSTKIVDLLLAAGATPDHLDKRGRTPLYVALQNKNPVIIHRLLEEGANTNIRMIEGLTPIQIAAQRGDIEVFETLIEKGAALETKNDNGRDALYWARKHHHYKMARMIEEMIEIDDD